jgi:hypothetical protein
VILETQPSGWELLWAAVQTTWRPLMAAITAAVLWRGAFKKISYLTVFGCSRGGRSSRPVDSVFQDHHLAHRVLLPVWQWTGLPVYVALHHKIGDREDSNEVTAV